jgi:hypothetical protein
VWFVMSLGAGAEEAADAAQSAFAGLVKARKNLKRHLGIGEGCRR